MLSTAQNDLLTQTGPGTPAGRLLRSYWQPIAAAEEMPIGGAPMPVRIEQVQAGHEPPGVLREGSPSPFTDFVCTSGYIEDNENGPSFCRRFLAAKKTAAE